MRVSPPGPESRVYRPAELNQEVRLHLEAGFPLLWIEAEISNLARPASGHLYFSLKDARAQIRCALFRRNAAQIVFKPENGQKVLVRGRLSLYEARGDYQLIADAMLEAGSGTLQAAFDALKKTLQARGLFDPERKQAIPPWPGRIAVVTSASGAAVQDILKVLSQRWPVAEVRIYPTRVQGDSAAAEIVRTLQAADQHSRADVILLARGGGSLEDLWAFNDESLAHAIVDCKTPIISGIGHETDTTIADYVADLRAPTPTAAATAATPDGPALKHRQQSLDSQLLRAMTYRLDQRAQTLDFLDRRLDQCHPEKQLDTIQARLHSLEQRLQRAHHRQLKQLAERLNALHSRLTSRPPDQRLLRAQNGIQQLVQRLHRAQTQQLDHAEARLGQLLRAMNAVNPLAVLERGYGVIRDSEGAALTQQNEFNKGKNINILMDSFEVDAEVKSDPRPARPS